MFNDNREVITFVFGLHIQTNYNQETVMDDRRKDQ